MQGYYDEDGIDTSYDAFTPPRDWYVPLGEESSYVEYQAQQAVSNRKVWYAFGGLAALGTYTVKKTLNNIESASRHVTGGKNLNDKSGMHRAHESVFQANSDSRVRSDFTPVVRGNSSIFDTFAGLGPDNPYQTATSGVGNKSLFAPLNLLPVRRPTIANAYSFLDPEWGIMADAGAQTLIGFGKNAKLPRPTGVFSGWRDLTSDVGDRSLNRYNPELGVRRTHANLGSVDTGQNVVQSSQIIAPPINQEPYINPKPKQPRRMYSDRRLPESDRGGGYVPAAGEDGVIVDHFNAFYVLPERDDLRLNDLRSRPSTLTDWYRTNTRYPLETAKYARDTSIVRGGGGGGGGGRANPTLCIGNAALAAAASFAVL